MIDDLTGARVIVQCTKGWQCLWLLLEKKSLVMSSSWIRWRWLFTLYHHGISLLNHQLGLRIICLSPLNHHLSKSNWWSVALILWIVFFRWCVPFYHGIYHHLVVGMSNHPVTKSGTSGDLTKPPQVRVAKNLDEDEDVPSLKLTCIAVSPPENRQMAPKESKSSSK